MPEAVIVSALRTPIGTANKGTLRDTDAYTLADHVVGRPRTSRRRQERSDRYGAASTTSSSERACTAAASIARHAAITAGLQTVPGLAVNRHCAAGQAAVQSAAASIRAGMDQLIIAGGVNSASTSPRFSRVGRRTSTWAWFPPTHPNTAEAPNMDMSITVGWNAAVKAGVTRAGDGRVGAGSHRKAIAAIDEGRFKEEIVPIDTPHGLFDTDEHPRRDTTIEKLASLKVLHPEIEGFSITAGNACGANDGAAVLTHRQRSARPARARHRQVLGVGRRRSGVHRPAPVEAIPKALKRAGLSVCRRRPVRDQRGVRVDVRGDRQAAGHRPRRSSTSAAAAARSATRSLPRGARMLVTLVHELRRRGGGIGVAAMCAGGGMGSATVIEVPAP